MDRISTETELNWEFVEPLNGNALSDLEERLKIGFSGELRTLSNDQTMALANGVLLWWAMNPTRSNMF